MCAWNSQEIINKQRLSFQTPRLFPISNLVQNKYLNVIIRTVRTAYQRVLLRFCRLFTENTFQLFCNICVMISYRTLQIVQF